MQQHLHIDFETYSEEDLKKVGLYKYREHPSFEPLMMSYTFNREKTQIVDFCMGETIPERVLYALKDPNTKKHAHNVPFELECLNKMGLPQDIRQWYCSMIKCAYMGIPLSLDEAGAALNLHIQKDKRGKELIKLFCTPQKATKTSPARRFFWYEDIEAWQAFKLYCIFDTDAERVLTDRLAFIDIPDRERVLYLIDRDINQRGIEIDTNFAINAYALDCEYKEKLAKEVQTRTGINPKSEKQFLEWLNANMDTPPVDCQKKTIEEILKKQKATISPMVKYMLEVRLQVTKTSNKKYNAMVLSQQKDKQVRNTLQFYGANRTGRWAGRLVQLHNLPQQKLKDLETPRQLVYLGDYEIFMLMYPNLPDVLKQLIRTAFIAGEGNTFLVADYSAIEARVTAWYADETWRLEVFATHGKIYEASASAMFKVPIEDCGKGTDYRVKGKYGELAFGFGGSVNAYRRFAGEDGEKQTDEEIKELVYTWRDASPNIVKLWDNLNNAAMNAVYYPGYKFYANKGIYYVVIDDWLACYLPSGRFLMYYKPEICTNRFGKPGLTYLNKEDNKLIRVDTYGGKLCENIVQATARDALGEAMIGLQAHRDKMLIVLHVHDEIICKTTKDNAEEKLEIMKEVMGRPIPWAPGLYLTAEGYITEYYRKD